LNFLIWLLLRIGWFSLVAYHDEALVTNVVWLALRDEAPIISESRTVRRQATVYLLLGLPAYRRDIAQTGLPATRMAAKQDSR
jgi:hypothetical protein